MNRLLLIGPPGAGKTVIANKLTELLNIYGFLCIIGRPGSGKTSFAISMIT